jgi:8-hydroxy-5-deazaflavin:NADPH oxidoreductase
MRIGIIGAGELGGTLAELWANAGHQVAIGDPQGSVASEDLVERIGSSARGVSIEEAARFGDVVVLSGPFGLPDALPPSPSVAGKVVIDAMNAVTESGEPMDLGGRASSDIIAEQFPDARIVKAFNTIQPNTLRSEARVSTPSGRRFVIFLAGDDGRAKGRVSTLIEEIGFTPIDTGSLAWGARLQEPGSKIFNQPMLPAEARRILSLIG